MLVSGPARPGSADPRRATDPDMYTRRVCVLSPEASHLTDLLKLDRPGTELTHLAHANRTGAGLLRWRASDNLEPGISLDERRRLGVGVLYGETMTLLEENGTPT